MASKPLVAPGRLRRPQLFLIFGALSFVWLGALMWMMHGMHNGGERLEEQMDFAGADIDSLYGVEDAVKCRISCEEHPRCLAFTYVKTDKACWLKGQGYSAKSNPNTISGSINETLKIARLSALNHSHDVGHHRRRRRHHRRHLRRYHRRQLRNVSGGNGPGNNRESQAYRVPCCADAHCKR